MQNFPLADESELDRGAVSPGPSLGPNIPNGKPGDLMSQTALGIIMHIVCVLLGL